MLRHAMRSASTAHLSARRPSGRRLSTVLVAPVADRVVASDLPALAHDRRREVVAFACHRIDHLPDSTRIGVLGVAAVYRAVALAPGGRRLVDALVRRRLPVLGEYVRLIRSLSSAYVWETWPGTDEHGGQP